MVETPLFLYDSDGNLITTDLDDPTSAKGVETHLIIGTKLGRILPSHEFEPLYRDFAEATAGTSARVATEALADLLRDEYGFDVGNRDLFLQERSGARLITYETLVKWIGTDDWNVGHWLEELPQEIQETHYLVTNSGGAQINGLDQNPHVRVGEQSLVRYFQNRLVHRGMVDNKKPAPDSYNLAVSSANPEPNDKGIVGIAFEDSKSGIEAAVAAEHRGGKLYVVGIGSHKTEEQLREFGADDFAPAMHEVDVPSLLERAGFSEFAGIAHQHYAER